MSSVLKHVDELSDEEIEQICNVFNKTFTTSNPMGIVIYRNLELWKDRYLKIKTNNEAKDVLVSMVKEGDKIFATTIVTIKNVYLDGEKVTAAFIDDVAVLPEKQGRGYGKKVFSTAQKFVDESDVIASFLYTEYKGKAWHIYSKYGYKDVFYQAYAFKIVDKHAFKKALKSKAMKLTMTFVPRGRIPEEKDVSILSENDYEKFNKLGREMNLFTDFTNYRLHRVELIVGNEKAYASASLRKFYSYNGFLINIGIISNMVYTDANDMEPLISTLTRKLVDINVAAIMVPITDNELKKIFKNNGYIVHGDIQKTSRLGTSTGMVKPINMEEKVLREKIIERKIFTTTEHIIGDW